jgi:uncharacterized protein
MSALGGAGSPARTHSDGRIRYGPGVFCCAGLATSDPAGATAFYASLFGWQSEELPAGDFGIYASFRRDGKEVAILYRQTREARAARAAPHWTPFVSVEDADASGARTRQRRPPRAARLPGRRPRRRRAGSHRRHPLALAAPRTGRGGGHRRCGCPLLARAGDRRRRPRQVLLRRAPRLGVPGPPERHTTITNGGDRIGWMRERTSREEGRPTGWIPYFGVESAHDTQQRAEQNGGRTLAAAADSPIGRTALLADSQGVTFALLELQASSSS